MEPFLKPMPDQNPEIEPVEKHTGIPLVVLGSGWIKGTAEISPNDKSRLDIDAKLRILAAGEFFLANHDQISEIILTGSDYDSGKSSQAQDLKDYLLKKFPEIDEKIIILEERPRSTADEAEAVKNRLGDEKVAFIITSTPALKRATKLFRNYGFEAIDGMGAEEYLKQVMRKGTSRRLLDPYQEKKFLNMLVNYQKSKKYQQFQQRENIQNIVLIIDKKARIPRIIASVTRKHQ